MGCSNREVGRWVKLAFEALETGQEARAEELLNRVTKVHPDHQRALDLLWRIQERDVPSAPAPASQETSHQRALETLKAEVRSLLDRRRVDDARWYFSQAADGFEPEEVAGLAREIRQVEIRQEQLREAEQLVRGFLEEGQAGSAQEALEELRNLGTSSSEIAALGSQLEKLLETEREREQVEEDGRHREELKRSFEGALAEGAFEEAEGFLKDLEVLRPENPGVGRQQEQLRARKQEMARLLEKVILDLSGREPGQARRSFEKLTQESPRHPDLAPLELRIKEEEARLEAEGAELLVGRVDELLAMGQLGEAREEINQHADRLPRQADTLRRRVGRAEKQSSGAREEAWRNLRDGKTGEARQSLEEARRLDQQAPGLKRLTREVERAERRSQGPQKDHSSEPSSDLSGSSEGETGSDPGSRPSRGGTSPPVSAGSEDPDSGEASSSRETGEQRERPPGEAAGIPEIPPISRPEADDPPEIPEGLPPPGLVISHRRPWWSVIAAFLLFSVLGSLVGWGLWHLQFRLPLSSEDSKVKIFVTEPLQIGCPETSNPILCAGDELNPSDFGPIDSFSIAKTETTWAHYQRCVRAKNCPRLDSEESVDDKNLPVTGVSWGEARAFCRWVKGRLPKEVEWELAARSSSEVDPAATMFLGNHGEELCCGPDSGDGWEAVAAVYDTEENSGGILGLQGNVAEWTASDYDASPSEVDDLEGSEPDRVKVVRGGSWLEPPGMMQPWVRQALPAGLRLDHVGFRCAWPAEAY
ncbi:MAG: SUMF1/EgtB/PvdO family nonheme iron enzyme [Deltaproteobacteria bacterium]|nr:SUMF1/EgtB/PvdO family nonheme iron enzyme [Deltaproteobacteria bacterium]